LNIQPAPALLYTLDQGREPQTKFEFGPSTLVIISGEDFPMHFGSGLSNYKHSVKSEHLRFMVHHLMSLLGTVPPILVDPVSPDQVRGAERLIEEREQDNFQLMIVTPTGHLNPEKPMRIVQEVRKHCVHNSTMAGRRIVLNPTGVMQSISKQFDVGLGVWPTTTKSKDYITFKDIEIVPSFHSSLRKIMEGGAKQATDTLLPRNIRLDD
jgi:hypothetical protein